MASIFDKYAPVPVKNIKKLTEEEDAQANFGKRVGRIEFNEGQNKLRICPKHPSEKHWMKMIQQYWMNLENNEGQLSRRTIPSGKIHGGLKVALTELYVDLCKLKFETSEKESDIKKLAAVTDWKTGLLPQTLWVIYAALIDKSGEKGPFETLELKAWMRSGILDEMQVEDDEEEMATDPFTHPKSGKYLLVTQDSKKKKASEKLKFKISDKTCPFTEEEMETFDRMTPLSRLPACQYNMKSFEQELEGLSNFDEEHSIGLFDSEEFQETIKQVKRELKSLATGNSKIKDADEEDDEKPKKSIVKKSTKKVEEDEEEEPEPVKKVAKKKVVEEPEEEEEEVVVKPKKKAPVVEEEEEEVATDELDGLDREELKQIIADEELEVTIKKSFEDDTIRELIRGARNPKKEDVEEEEEEAPAPKKKSGSGTSLDDVRARLAARTKK